MSKTYNHYIDGKKVATYKQPNLKIEKIKNILEVVSSIMMIALLSYLYMIVTL